LSALAAGLLCLSVLGLAVCLLQHVAVRLHRRATPSPTTSGSPGISVLKPLCGVDDELLENLESFAALDYPEFELLLGIASRQDAAYPVACTFAERMPARARVVVQARAGGLNPKVGQLIGLAAEARHDLLVVSDSNVRVEPGYLREIAEHLSDPTVGLVTHPIAGLGERSLGSLLDNLGLSSTIEPSMIAAQRLAGFRIVIGKSMALRRSDLAALGGFERVQDVLAEDYILGRMVVREAGKRVVVARSPVINVSTRRSVADFVDRYARWGVTQRAAVGTGRYGCLVLRYPISLAAAAALVHPGSLTCAALALSCAARTLMDAWTARVLHPSSLGRRALAIALKDVLLCFAWAHGLLRREVTWRGTRLRVLAGSRLARLAEGRGLSGDEGAWREC